MDGQQRDEEAAWEGLRLVVERCPSHYQAFIYDPAKVEVLYTCSRVRFDLAQFAAVEYAASVRFGFDHFLKLETVMQSIAWEARKKPLTRRHDCGGSGR